MPGGNDLVKVQRIGLGNGTQIVGAIRDVLEGARITATAIADAAKLQVPGRKPLRSERFGKRFGVVLRPLRQPRTAVNKHDHRVATRRWRCRRQPQVRKLQRVTLPVDDARIG